MFENFCSENHDGKNDKVGISHKSTKNLKFSVTVLIHVSCTQAISMSEDGKWVEEDLGEGTPQTVGGPAEPHKATQGASLKTFVLFRSSSYIFSLRLY